MTKASWLSAVVVCCTAIRLCQKSFAPPYTEERKPWRWDLHVGMELTTCCDCGIESHWRKRLSSLSLEQGYRLCKFSNIFCGWLWSESSISSPWLLCLSPILSVLKGSFHRFAASDRVRLPDCSYQAMRAILPRVCRMGTETFCWATLSKSRIVHRLAVLLFSDIWMLIQPLSVLIAADHRYSMRREEGLLDFITDKQQNEYKKPFFVARIFLWSDFSHQTSRVFEVTKLCPICE